MPCVRGGRPEPVKTRTWGFGVGAGLGIVLATLALTIAGPAAMFAETQTALGAWLDANLGRSVWLFAIVLTLYGLNLHRLKGLLAVTPTQKEVVELDQLIDVWTHLFIGIGVIWTAIGMRSALQSALGDPGAALVDTADNVLQKLVDGGILLALTTTIVGGIGGYVMRLVKTMLVGASLHDYYETLARTETRELLLTVQRIERKLTAISDVSEVELIHGVGGDA